MFILLPAPGTALDFHATDEEYLNQCKKIFGDDSIPVEILGVSKWFINEIVAEYYSDGTVHVSDRIVASLIFLILTIFNSFYLGDTIHRHPPFNGLDSNTCIQDAFNLAWKIAYVEKGIAGRSLLDSFNAERQPVRPGSRHSGQRRPSGPFTCVAGFRRYGAIDRGEQEGF
jgi:hypothetical protein